MDKKFWQSKKFVAFIFSSIIIAGVLIVALVVQEFTMAMGLFMAIGMLGLTATTIGYVISQGSLDKFITGVTNMSKGILSKDKVDDRVSKEDLE